MQVSEQGVQEKGRRRHHVIPRSLILVTSTNPASGEEEVLLLKGAPTKRLWANQYNGLGGHIEAHEDVHEAALRELHEETGLTAVSLALRGVVHIDTGQNADGGPNPGVMMFVFCGGAESRLVKTSAEGTPEWIPIAQLAAYPLVDDLYDLIPLALADGPVLFGHYSPQLDGSMQYRFSAPCTV
ncbi:MAG: NUDIX domain-containing protein [Caldilineaceae bacterium]